MEATISQKGDFNYFSTVARIISLLKAAKYPEKEIKGREIDLLSLMAVARKEHGTLAPKTVRDWIMKNGQFDNTDMYRYTSQLKKKGWIQKKDGTYLLPAEFHRSEEEFNIKVIRDDKLDEQDPSGEGPSGN